jgi:ferredoxin--NADP+ reductase
LLETGSLESIAGAPLDPATDRVMICGSMAMLRDMRDTLESRGFTEGSNARPGTLVIEKAFVD